MTWCSGTAADALAPVAQSPAGGPGDWKWGTEAREPGPSSQLGPHRPPPWERYGRGAREAAGFVMELSR